MHSIPALIAAGRHGHSLAQQLSRPATIWQRTRWLLATAMILAACGQAPTPPSTAAALPTATSIATASTNAFAVKPPKFGPLHVAAGALRNSAGQIVQLRGISSHGLAWYPRFVNEPAMRWVQADWGANLFRIAMITDPNSGGYVGDPYQKQRVIDAVDDALALGLYVIIDWHILFDGDPNAYRNQARAFFQEMATRYGHNPHVIYEICNEPNGANIHWANKIKPYALDIIPAIRAIDPDNIILVGTGNWSQDVHEPADDPLPFSNMMYVAHFYAGSHTQWLRDRIDYALGKGLPIFISEWGSSEANGDGGPYYDETRRWLNFIEQRQLSNVNWSLADKAEGSAAVMPGASPYGGWSDSQLTPAGRLVRDYLRAYR